MKKVNKTILIAVIATLTPILSCISFASTTEDAFFAFNNYYHTTTLERFNIGSPVTTIGVIPELIYAADFDNHGQLWACFLDGNLAIVNQQTAEYSIKGNSGIGFQSITFGPRESLYGVAGRNMYLVDKNNANVTLLAELNVDDTLIGLVFMDSEDVFYGMDYKSRLYKIDSSFQTTKLGTIPNLQSPRGLTLGSNGDILAVTRSSGLFKIDQGLMAATDMATPLPWDNQSLAYGPIIPEPTTLLLLGLGGILIRRRK